MNLVVLYTDFVQSFNYFKGNLSASRVSCVFEGIPHLHDIGLSSSFIGENQELLRGLSRLSDVTF